MSSIILFKSNGYAKKYHANRCIIDSIEETAREEGTPYITIIDPMEDND